MAKLTQNDRDVRDARKVKSRVLNLLRLTESALSGDVGMCLTREDNNDLEAAKKSFENLLGRYRTVELPKKA